MIIFIPNDVKRNINHENLYSIVNKYLEASSFKKVNKQPRGGYGSRMAISDFNDPSEVLWYHGSINKFNKFSKTKTRQFIIFVSQSIDFAKGMARGGVVYVCKISPGGKWWDFRNKEDVLWLLPKAIKFDKGFLEYGLGVRVSVNPSRDDLIRYLHLWFKQDYNRVWEVVEPYSPIISRNGYTGYYIQEDGVLNLGVFKSSFVSIISSEGESAPVNQFGFK